jgi:RHS repeat-associated protein
MSYREFSPLGAWLWQQTFRITGSMCYASRRPNTLRRLHAYGDGINLTGITEDAVAGRNESYTYTPTNRLLNATGIWGSLTWSYDGVGNRTQEVLNDGSTVTTSDYGYPAGSNRLDDVTQGSSTVRSFTHDAAGNITHDDRAGTVYRYLYNDRGRLMQFRIDNQVRANYRYDFFERLNWRQTLNMTPAGATHYVQDLNGQLIYEATDTGTPLREYVWIDDMPLAVFADLDTASPQLYFVHPDHLNRPLRMTDGTQAVVWDAVYKPFGEAHSITGSATLNLRFPGQYFLIESGLHYNWHRHYDATLGRFTQPDPLEFVDGPSLYAYALSSPSMHTDPLGQDITICFYPTDTFGHVGFGVREDSTFGFYPKEGSYDFFGGPGDIYEDPQAGGQCKLVKSRRDQDDCMLQCRSTRSANPGPYDLRSTQCTSFVRECLIACGISAGSSSSRFPYRFYKGLSGK